MPGIKELKPRTTREYLEAAKAKREKRAAAKAQQVLEDLKSHFLNMAPERNPNSLLYLSSLDIINQMSPDERYELLTTYKAEGQMAVPGRLPIIPEESNDGAGATAGGTARGLTAAAFLSTKAASTSEAGYEADDEREPNYP